MLVGEVPYAATALKHCRTLAEYVKNSDVVLHKDLSKEMRQLLECMLKRDTSQRIGWAALYQTADVHIPITWYNYLQQRDPHKRISFGDVCAYIRCNGMLE